ncbi:PDZ domain [Trinorchestia longiramus]|nr:PDZ domain [Trinorchestia longiramus]
MSGVNDWLFTIEKVTVGSVAEQAGVRVGDSIVSIGGTDAFTLRHKEAQDAILKAGNSFQLVVQRGSSLWKPKVTPLAQPASTPQGPVATHTSLAKNQATKINIGSCHNTSPRPFPGPGTWATSPVFSHPSSSIHPSHPTGPIESTPQNALSRTNMYSEETGNDSQYVSRSRVSMKDEIASDVRSNLFVSSNENLLSHSGGDSTDGSFRATFGSTNPSKSTSKTWRSPGNSTPQLTSSRDNLSDVHHASFIVESEKAGNRSTSPPFPPPPPPLQSARSDSSTGLVSPMRSPSPGGGNVQGHNSSFSNRSPSPYHANCFSSRTPRSLSPSCSIPSMPSTGSLANIGVIGSPPNTSSMTAATRSHVLDPVSDIEKDGSLKIEGADITLDKENARNFLQMQLDKERAKELYLKSLSSESKAVNGAREINEQTVYPKGRKCSYGSPLHNRSNSVAVDNALINAGIKNYFANKSTENIYLKSNSVDKTSGGGSNSASPWGAQRSSKVSDNIKLFDGGRRHSSFTPLQSGGRLNFKSHTLDRSTYGTTPPVVPSGVGRYSKHGSDTSKRVSSRWRGGEGPLRKTPFSGSCSNLSYTSDEKFNGEGELNCNVPWRNHFSELRRRSLSAMSAGTLQGHGPTSEPGSGNRVRVMA